MNLANAGRLSIDGNFFKSSPIDRSIKVWPWLYSTRIWNEVLSLQCRLRDGLVGTACVRARAVCVALMSYWTIPRNACICLATKPFEFVQWAYYYLRSISYLQCQLPRQQKYRGLFDPHIQVKNNLFRLQATCRIHGAQKAYRNT